MLLMAGLTLEEDLPHLPHTQAMTVAAAAVAGCARDERMPHVDDSSASVEEEGAFAEEDTASTKTLLAAAGSNR